MEAIQIGPFIIKYSWMFVLIGWLAAYGVTKRMAAGSNTFKSEFLDAMMTAAVISILVAKAAILLFRPALIGNFISALYLSTGLAEQSAGIASASIYLYWKFKRKQWNTDIFSKITFVFIATFLTISWLARTLFFLFF